MSIIKFPGGKASTEPRQLALASRIGLVLEGESIMDAGAALSLAMGQFILLLENTNKGIDAGIDALSGDAKTAARLLRKAQS